MGHSKRGSKLYLYRCRRGPNGFEKDYLGSGPVAEIASTGMALNQVRRENYRIARRAEIEFSGQAGVLLERLRDWTDFMVAAQAWIGRSRPSLRKWHFMTEQADAGLADTTLFADLRRTVAAANAGDLGARHELCQLLDKQSAVWKCVSDLAGMTEERLIKLATGGEHLLTESLRRKTAEMKNELGGDSATPLQRLLIERITASWLHLQVGEMALAAAETKGEIERSQRALALAHRQHLEAIQVFATIRPESPTLKARIHKIGPE
jgi:hypothetical protein